VAERPVTILIAALGGEGGGVLTEWLVQAASAADLPVQSTSIPGVAQRTGATTYYVELWPETNAALRGRRPLLALYPGPGDIDVVVASEPIEAGRAVENGYVTPDRTTVVAATHRVYAIEEKTAAADGRFETERVLRALRELARAAILLDVSDHPDRPPLNAVLLGAVAGTGVLPIDRGHFENAIRASGIAVEANLRGFELGLGLAAGTVRLDTRTPAPPAVTLPSMIEEARDLPPDCRATVELGLARLVDYQDEAYARLYLDRVRRLAGQPFAAEAARQLALWMSYEDVIRVADLKTRAERLRKVRAEVGARDGEPVRITEYLKPGLDELTAVLPNGLGGPLQRIAERRGLLHRLNLPLHLRSSSILGYLALRTLARMRPLRRRSFRFALEQVRIEAWLRAMEGAGPALGREIALLPELLRGYGDTHRRGVAAYESIMARVVAPLLARDPGDAEPVRRAREVAQADPEGDGLARALQEIEAGLRGPLRPVAAE
jgi:indolepyruvate ferredoxin oxidoreductase, beta subunit